MTDETMTTERTKPRLPAKTGASRTRPTLKLDDGYLPLAELARYSGLSVRYLQMCMAQPVHPLPYYRWGKKVEVRRSEFDAWAKQHHRGTKTETPFDARAEVDARIGRTRG